jgi:hypothetical protein
MRKLSNEELDDLVTMMGQRPEGLPKPNGHIKALPTH